MPEIRGNLRDLGAATMAGRRPRVHFTPTNPGVTPSGTVISIEPVIVEPDQYGDFAVNLVSTLNLLPRTQMTVSVDWLVSDDARIPWMEIGSRSPGGGTGPLQLDVPERDASLAALIQAAATPGAGMFVAGTTPPPNPERWQYWIDTSSSPPALKKRRD